MQAIIPQRPARVAPYAWAQVSVNPNPPRVGEVTRITYPLANPDPSLVVVERIVTHVAQFGMGMTWDDLAVIGPFELPADPAHVLHAGLDWTPQTGGHRCLRAEIYVRDHATPLRVGRNLDVIEAGVFERSWRVPFHLGNPEEHTVPIQLRMAALDRDDVEMALWVNGRLMPNGEAIQLRPGEVVPAELELRAPEGPALAAVRTVEAFIAGRLLDGIQVMLTRSALVQPDASRPWVYDPGVTVPAQVLVAVR